MRLRHERPCLVLKYIICLHIYEHIDKMLPLNSFRLADTVALSGIFSWDCICYLHWFLSLLLFEGEMFTYNFTSSLYTEATAHHAHYFAFDYPYSSNYRFVAHWHQAVVCNLTGPVWVCWQMQWFSLLPLIPLRQGLFVCIGQRWNYSCLPKQEPWRTASSTSPIRHAPWQMPLPFTSKIVGRPGAVHRLRYPHLIGQLIMMSQQREFI